MKIEAGRELDALVAEKVMGRERFPGDPKMLTCRNDGLSCTNPVEPEPYSTDIAAAWQVMERLRDLCHFTVMRQIVPSGWTVDAVFNDSIFVTSVFNESAPLAICLVALKAVGIDFS